MKNPTPLILGLALATRLVAAATDPILPDPDAENPALKPVVVTQPVRHDSDDPAIWINAADPSGSLVLGTDKDKNGALFAWDLQGRLVRTADGLARPNNVDVAQGVRHAGGTEDLAVLTERNRQRLRVFRLPLLEPADKGDLVVFDGDESRSPMGVALYQRPRDGALFVIVGGKSGPSDNYLWQYQLLRGEDGHYSMRKVREFGRYSGRKEIEAIVVDSEAGYVYYSDEQHGIHKYLADPEAPEACRELALFGTGGFASDIEGLSLYKFPDGTGYLIVSNQQADTFRIFPREGTKSSSHHHPLLASVRLSTRESDGSEVTSASLPGFEGGLFVAMSCDRTFQYYRWKDLATAAGLRVR